MPNQSDHERILAYLRRRPSVASACAIGHYHVLNGAPLAVALNGIEALGEMPCDWTVAILEQAMTDPSRTVAVRRAAVAQTLRLLLRAIGRGYSAMAAGPARVLAEDLTAAVAAVPASQQVVEQLAEELCIHLGEAVEQGILGRIPNL